MSSGAKWPINADSKHAGLNKLHNQEGRWNLDAVAAKDLNFNELVHTGLRMEVLHWKILVEEPGACSLISQASNKSNTLALRTSEITALAAVAGAVTMAPAKKRNCLVIRCSEGSRARRVGHLGT